jgi:hypothetical protein
MISDELNAASFKYEAAGKDKSSIQSSTKSSIHLCHCVLNLTYALEFLGQDGGG